jgi:hypothetical protein
MRNRILKRPMFRLGGSAENEGIMDGMRRRYAEGTGRDEIVQNTGLSPLPKPEVEPEVERVNKRPSFRDILINSPNLSPFLTEFGLNLLSQPPTGNIFQTAATAAKGPFERLQAKSAVGSQRDFERELLERKLDVQKEIAAGDDQEYDMAYKLGLDKFQNPALAKNFARYYTTIEPTVESQFGSQFGGLIEQDVSQQKIARQVGKNLDKQGKLNKVFYDVYTGSFKRLIKDQTGNYNFVSVAGSANLTDIEGTTLPEEKDSSEKYREDVNKFFKEKRKKQLDEFRDKYDISSEDDIDI